MKTFANALRALVLCGGAFGAVSLAATAATPAVAATSIQVVVNGQPITNYDIEHRIAFLRLQHTKGDLRAKAKEQMVEQTLKAQAIARAHASVSTDAVDASYARFAKANKLTPSQLTQILTRAGVGEKHFKSFIAVQMSWPRLVKAHSAGQADTHDLVSKMLENGKEKPSTTEYILQQVIFVVPKGKKSTLSIRKTQAEGMRSRFQGCDNTRDVAAQLRDVAVRDLGRIMEPELPPDWKDYIDKTPQGKTTPIRVTDRGVEFIAVCSAKKVSDDLAAATVFKAQSEDESSSNSDSKDLLDLLRKHATIINP
ncbi:MAG: peptidylprolyl isomerase [Pararhizobium sp.]